MRVFWPGVAGIAAHELAADLRVEALPEAREVGGGLDGALIGGEKVHDDRRAVGAEARGVGHAEEVLQARGDPGGAVGFVVDAGLAAAAEAEGGGPELFELAAVELAFE